MPNEAWIVVNPDASHTCKCYKCGYKTIVAPEKILSTKIRELVKKPNNIPTLLDVNRFNVVGDKKC